MNSEQFLDSIICKSKSILCNDVSLYFIHYKAMYLHKSPCRYKKKITVLNKNSLPSVDLLGEEASGGGQGPGHGPDAEDGQQHRHTARLGGQRLHDRLQY